MPQEPRPAPEAGPSARRRRAAVVAALVAAAGLCLAAGCARGPSASYERDRMVVELADVLRREALDVQDEGRRERLVTGLIQLRDLMVKPPLLKASEAHTGAGPELPEPEGGSAAAPGWATLFAPRSLVIGFFTRSRNFDDVPGDDGLEVRVQPLDQFGDPTKAIGSYRIEVFAYRTHTGEPRGGRLGHWFVSVLDGETNRRYYDPVDRTYVFPLVWDHPIDPGTPAIVQATYYPPGGFTEKLFAQRLIRIGEGSEEETVGTVEAKPATE